MGHERLGRLPKTKKWKDIVANIALSSTNESSTEEIIEKTAEAIDSRFRNLHRDPGIQDVFSFLLSITIASRSQTPYDHLASFGIDLHGKPATPLGLAQALSTFLTREGGSTEYVELAKSAANKALANFYKKETAQADLFASQEDPFAVWRKASDGRGFCFLAREFFSAFTTNYIQYFLEREASSVIPSLQARNIFQKNIEAHIDDVTSHSFETSKIAQSFAAGWYNKNAKQEIPSSRKTSGFLSIVLNKIRDSLSREGRVL